MYSIASRMPMHAAAPTNSLGELLPVVKMNKPPVSVVMVTCNVERFLGESIESILGQTFRGFEFVIVDFGSTDNSKSIISSYAAMDSRIKFHIIPSCGLAEARNTGCL